MRTAYEQEAGFPRTTRLRILPLTIIAENCSRTVVFLGKLFQLDFVLILDCHFMGYLDFMMILKFGYFGLFLQKEQTC